MIQRSRFDSMNQLLRRTLRRDVVEESARLRLVFGDAQHAQRQNIEAAEIVQQPAIKTELDDSLLNFF